MECNQKQINYKDIIGSFLPLIVAMLAQYVVNFIDVIALFLQNMHSSEKTYSSKTIESIMQEAYNQPMNKAYMTMAQHAVFILCFGIWYYKVFYKTKSDGEKLSRRTFLSLCTLFLVTAGFSCQAMMDGILTMVRPLFPTAFAQYDELVSTVSGANNSWAMMVTVICLAPIGEELLFRGLIQGYAARYMPAYFAILFQGVLFGLYHGNLVQGIYAMILGCILGFVAHRTKCVIPCIILHLCINASLFVVPAVWFNDTVRCVIITLISAIVFFTMIWLVTRNSQKDKGNQTGN